MNVQVMGFCAVMVLVLVAMPGVSAAGTTGISAEQLANAVQDVAMKEPVAALPKIGVQPGKEFLYNVWVYDIRDLGNMDAEILFEDYSNEYGKDLQYMKCSNVAKGSINLDSIFDYRITSRFGDISENVDKMYIRFSFASQKGMSGSGTIASIRCVLDKEPRWPIVTKFNMIDADRIDGSRLLINKRVSGDIHYERLIKGDCDNDGYASTRDALMIIQMSVGKIAVDKGCDVNSDGGVDSADARDLLKRAQGYTGSGSNSGTGNTASGSGAVFNGREALLIPLPNPQNLGIGGKGVAPIPIP